MSRKDVPAIKLTLSEVCEQFEIWRKTKQKRDPIPEELWQAAVTLAPDYSIQEISKTLHLSYPDLKRRILAVRGDVLPETVLTPGFVELDIGRSVSPLECVFEVEDASGAKTKLSVKGPAGLDLRGLAEAFWGKGHS